jgi:hypothetical protein
MLCKQRLDYECSFAYHPESCTSVSNTIETSVHCDEHTREVPTAFDIVQLVQQLLGCEHWTSQTNIRCARIMMNLSIVRESGLIPHYENIQGFYPLFVMSQI